MKKYRKKSNKNDDDSQYEYESDKEQSLSEDFIKTENSQAHDFSGNERNEGFVQSHIRIITFIVCSVVLAGVITLWCIFRNSNNPIDITNKTDITMMNIYGISEKKNNIMWSDFDMYNYEDQSYSGAVKREYEVKGTDYVVWVGGKNADGKPEYVYLINMATSKHIDLTKDDPRDFVK